MEFSAQVVCLRLMKRKNPTVQKKAIVNHRDRCVKSGLHDENNVIATLVRRGSSESVHGIIDGSEYTQLTRWGRIGNERLSQACLCHSLPSNTAERWATDARAMSIQ